MNANEQLRFIRRYLEWSADYMKQEGKAKGNDDYFVTAAYLDEAVKELSRLTDDGKR